ncbi:hypothetical protein B0H34DRAFT_517281 [Crassisporium funariophilum]|nr:hypothetical protein B0H34DRAFT_517281 [Crassisporium funariophilum]
MPLFGSKHKHDDTTGAGHHTTGTTGPTTAGTFPNQTHPQQGITGHHGQGQTGLTGNQGFGGRNNFDATQQMHPGNLGAGGPGHFQNDDPYAPGGIGHTQAAGGPTGIPPTNVVNSGHNTAGHGSGTRMTGKVESAIGSMVGSNALKAKGLQKEQEANSVKLQGRELAEAERLEREALMRRERAVGHGAHPANSALGAGHIGQGGAGGGMGGTYN